MKTQNILSALLLAGTAGGLSVAHAAPAVQAPSGSFSVGQTVSFTVHDGAVDEGLDSGFYSANFSFTWDPAVFRILDQPLLLSNPLTSLLGSGGTVVVSGLGFGLDVNTPPSNIGVYQVSMLTDPPALSGDVELFTLSFQALQASPSARIGVEPVAGGAYGTGSPFMPSASTPITVLPSAVPEPATWALGLSGLALLVGIGSRRRRL